MFGRPTIITIGLYIGFVVLVIAMGLFTYYVDTRRYFVGTPADPEALAKAADIYAGMVTLLTTLATGLLAGMGWFFTKRPKRGDAERDLWPAISGASCACLSIVFGYVGSENLEWAIEYSVGTLDLPKLQWPKWFQFYTLLLSVFFFVDFVRRNWTKVDLDEDSTNSGT